MLAHGILAQSQYAAPPAGPAYVTDGLVGYWDANDGSSYPGSGTTWTDLSGNGYDTTATGTPSYTSGTPSYFTFNQDYQFKVVNTTAAQTTNGDHTWFIAVNIDNWVNYQGICGTTDGGSVVQGTSRMKAQTNSSQNRFAIQNWNNISNATNAWAAANYSTGTWYIIGGTMSWTSNTNEIFINNVSKGTGSIGGTPSGALNTIHIGDVTNALDIDALQGKVGLVMLYNKVLNSSELTQNWDAFKTTYGLS